MTCEAMRVRILDLALDERIGDPALCAHLDSCAGCRDALASRRVLLAAIDRVVIEELREEPSRMLAARVRQAIEDSGARPHASWPGAPWRRWVPAAATLAFALLVGLAIRERLASSIERVPIQPAPSATSMEGAQGRSSAEATASATGAVRDPVRSDPARPHRPHLGDASRPAARVRAFPEVIVPAEEMNAVLRLSAAAAARPVFVRAPEDGEAVAKHGLEPLSIERIEITPLVLAPLEVGAPQRATPVTL